MREILQTIYKLYDGKIVLFFLILFGIIQVSFFQRVPDYFNLQKIESAESFILRLLSIVIGFSSFILTILLVVYNSLTKKIRRNSFEFILDNNWIRFTFSLFCGSLIFISLSVFFIQRVDLNTILTLLYFSSFITFGNLFIQFPLIILCIKHSNSYDTIKDLICKVSEHDMDNLYNPSSENNFRFIEDIEKNRIIQLKDIGISAIKENDWGLPQTILNDLYEKLIIPLNKNSDDKIIKRNLHVFNFICKHFKKVSIEEIDEITINVLLNNLLRTHIYLANNEIRIIRNNPIDQTILDLFRLLIVNNNFYNYQPYLLNKTISLINEHINSMNYSDEEVPTMEYNILNSNNQRNYDLTIAKNYWFYLKNELPDIFFKPLEIAIESKNKNVYSSFNWQLHSLFDNLTSSKSLTVYQENEIFQEYSYRARRITDLAMNNGIYVDIEFYTHYQIENWIINNKKYGFSTLSDYSFFLTKLNRSNNLYTSYIDDFFMIARSICLEKLDKNIKLKVLNIVIKDSIAIFENVKSEQYVKDEIIRQLIWLNESFLKGREYSNLKKIIEKKLTDF